MSPLSQRIYARIESGGRICLARRGMTTRAQLDLVSEVYPAWRISMEHCRRTRDRNGGRSCQAISASARRQASQAYLQGGSLINHTLRIRIDLVDQSE